MSDWMWNFRWWYGGGSTPSWLLRQQKRAIKQAGKKLEEIDKKFSTKVLKDDIKAESLLTNIGEVKTIIWSTVWGIIKTNDQRIILIRDKISWRWFPKGWQEIGEDELSTLYREIQEETGLKKNNLKLLKKLWEYEWYSKAHQWEKIYKWYSLEVIDNTVKLQDSDNKILEIGKFDMEEIMNILEVDHQKQFRNEVKNQL